MFSPSMAIQEEVAELREDVARLRSQFENEGERPGRRLEASVSSADIYTFESGWRSVRDSVVYNHKR